MMSPLNELSGEHLVNVVCFSIKYQSDACRCIMLFLNIKRKQKKRNEIEEM
jgi:hypothetical protein